MHHWNTKNTLGKELTFRKNAELIKDQKKIIQNEIYRAYELIKWWQLTKWKWRIDE